MRVNSLHDIKNNKNQNQRKRQNSQNSWNGNQNQRLISKRKEGNMKRSMYLDLKKYKKLN